MQQLSNSDFALALRLLYVFSRNRGETIKEKENARLAARLVKKLRKRKEKNDG